MSKQESLEYLKKLFSEKNLEPQREYTIIVTEEGYKMFMEVLEEEAKNHLIKFTDEDLKKHITKL